MLGVVVGLRVKDLVMVGIRNWVSVMVADMVVVNREFLDYIVDNRLGWG